MEHRSIYAQIAVRTDGTVYIGVVGPVRTGKSTFIKRFMEQLVLPNIENVYERERATDELPQSGSGRTIMTAAPKFVPNEAARISPDGKTTLQVRLIDSVGYMIPGAVGDTEAGKPRMVTTPWASEELPMAQAAELGTKKVMEDHSSIGVGVTTDGTVTDIPREDYREAEARAIADMQKTGKPFVVVVNTQGARKGQADAISKPAALWGKNRPTYAASSHTPPTTSPTRGRQQIILLRSFSFHSFSGQVMAKNMPHAMKKP